MHESGVRVKRGRGVGGGGWGGGGGCKLAKQSSTAIPIPTYPPLRQPTFQFVVDGLHIELCQEEEDRILWLAAFIVCSVCLLVGWLVA